MSYRQGLLMFESITVPRKLKDGIPEADHPFVENWRTYDLSDKELLKKARSLIQRHQEYLAELYKEGYKIPALLETHKNFLDKHLTFVYENLGLDQYSSLALIAVGGYGRGEMFPASDVDIMVACNNEDIPEAVSAKIETFISTLWDLKLDLGPTVRTINEAILAARSDITIETNLLESRFITGSSAVYSQLISAIRIDSFWTSDKFFNEKITELEERHHQYKDTAYSIEPDVKNNPGGLRDLQVVQWIANRYFDVHSAEGMFKAGLMTKEEYDEYIECTTFLMEVRFALQCLITGNRLTLDVQKSLASILGYGDSGNKPVENMMKELFRTFRRVRELYQIIMQIERYMIRGRVIATAEPVEFLDSFFVKRGNLIDVIDPYLFTNDPKKMIEMFGVIAKHPDITGLHYNCIRVLRESRRKLSSHLYQNADCRNAFKNLLKAHHCLKKVWHLMHESRLLASYMPQWEHIEGLTQFDMFHTFSVDEHIIRVLTNIEVLSQSREPEHAFFHNVIKQISEPLLLNTAAFLHDIAKGRNGHHAEEGAKEALSFCNIHDYSNYETELVSWLVAHHLDFSSTAMRRDITDPEEINNFANLVKDEEHLNMLYCLTVADIAATNEHEWNSWKDNIFRQLYMYTSQALHGSYQGQKSQMLQAQENIQVAVEITKDVRKSDLLRHFAQLPTEYFIHYSPTEIGWHARNIMRFKKPEAPLILFNQMEKIGTELLIYYRNFSPMFFGQVVYAMAMKQLNLFSAQLFLTHDNHTICTIKFQNRKGQPLDNDRLHTIRMAILDSLQKTPDIESIKNIKSKIFSVPTKINFLKESQTKRSNLEITTLDTPGLLARIGITLGKCQCLISAARVTTSGERADDFFSVTDIDGLPLDDSKQQELSSALMEALA